ncbi:hypothetical protein JQ625_07055 [Bradyrhizobium diazoefficiens]|nr:hypothetical protein [Bradyrhizobium diazoefficiens]MBR0774582.1 hypothetical protein [Bradyrhizobium diazoefficiens]
MTAFDQAVEACRCSQPFATVIDKGLDDLPTGGLGDRLKNGFNYDGWADATLDSSASVRA